jgi:DNA-directed RNA polymerase II subunit RPB2
MEFVTEAFQKELITAHHKQNGYARFQKDSYEHFVDVLVPQIVAEYSNPAVVHDSASTGRRHVLSFGNIHVDMPRYREPDGSVTMLLPEEARHRQLDYCVQVYVDVHHDIFPLADVDVQSMPVYKTDDESVEWTMHLPRSEEHSSFNDVPFFEIPAMLHTRFCNLSVANYAHRVDTNMLPQEIKFASVECPKDEGGYFVIRGLNRTLQMQERLRTNTPFLFANKISRTNGKRGLRPGTVPLLSANNARRPNKYGFTCEVRSRHEVKIRSTSTLQVHVTWRRGGTPPEVYVTLPFLTGMDVPLVAVFRMLGFHDLSHIQKIVDPDDGPHVMAILNHACAHMSENEVFDYVGRYATKEVTLEARKKAMMHLLSNEMLPHLGLRNTREECLRKVVYLGVIVRRLLRAYDAVPSGFTGDEVESLEIMEVDDRDNYIYKRVDTAGTMMALLLRQLMRKFIKQLRRQLAHTVEARRPLNIPNLMKTQKITSDLRYAFRTGNWNVKRMVNNQNVGITQIITRMSFLALKSQLGRVNTPLNRDGKLTRPRQAHMSTWGILCPNETPEGSGCGLVKNLAVLTHIRVGCPNASVVFVLDYLGMVSFDAHPEPWTQQLVLVNGNIVGVTSTPNQLIDSVRDMRRKGHLPFDLTVARVLHGVNITTDAGACLRPLLLLTNLGRLPAVLAQWRQYPHLNLWSLMCEHALIEYLDKEEEACFRVAVTLQDVASHPVGTFSHMEIAPSTIFGHCAAQIPFSNHNQAPRNIYQASMGKQAVSVPCLNFDAQLEAQMHVPMYTQRPLVETGNEDPDFAMGINAMVAIISMGYNQEDSVIMNKSFIERGGFRSMHYSVMNVEQRVSGVDKETFENPSELQGVVNMKQADYQYLDTLGTVQLHAHVKKDMVIMGKTMNLQQLKGLDQKYNKRDNSVVYHGLEKNCVVDRVVLTNVREGVNAQRVRLRNVRVPEVGDKFSSRHGQKGTVGAVLRQDDLPFSVETGMSPDIVINACAIPSRMTIGHLLETLAAKTGVVLGKLVNGTPFRALNVDTDICSVLHKLGFQRHGNERMISGTTGELMEAAVFMGPTYYQRLKHMVADKVHSRNTGPHTIMTRQPSEGRARNGGLRLGEMERDCLVSHGASQTLLERFLHASDAFHTPMCRQCGILADPVYCTEFGETIRGKNGYCRNCRSGASVGTVIMPYVYKLLLQELAAVGFNVVHKFKVVENNT